VSSGSSGPTGPRSDVLLAVVVEGIAHGGIPLNSMDDVAALYAWLVAIVPTCQEPPPIVCTGPPWPLLAPSTS